MTNAISNTQNKNKCPHGFPSGTCPICNGMSASGRPKDRNKPRVAGEMSYNECMAVWIRMQRAKQAKIQDKLDKINAAKEANIKENIRQEQIRIQNKIDIYFQNIDNTVKTLPPIVKIIVAPAIKIIHATLNIVIKIAFNFANFVASVSEKMAMVLSDIKNHIEHFFQKTKEKVKKVIKTILSLFMEFEHEEENSDKQKIEEIIKNAIKKILKKEKEKEKEKNNELV